jgi:hypothetical protein
MSILPVVIDNSPIIYKGNSLYEWLRINTITELTSTYIRKLVAGNNHDHMLQFFAKVLYDNNVLLDIFNIDERDYAKILAYKNEVEKPISDDLLALLEEQIKQGTDPYTTPLTSINNKNNNNNNNNNNDNNNINGNKKIIVPECISTLNNTSKDNKTYKQNHNKPVIKPKQKKRGPNKKVIVDKDNKVVKRWRMGDVLDKNLHDDGWTTVDIPGKINTGVFISEFEKKGEFKKCKISFVPYHEAELVALNAGGVSHKTTTPGAHPITYFQCMGDMIGDKCNCPHFVRIKPFGFTSGANKTKMTEWRVSQNGFHSDFCLKEQENYII